MAVGTTGGAGTSIRNEASGSYVLPMVLMVALYFSIGFITALNDILIPHFKDLFHLTNVLALLVDLCFFGAYFVMSLPSGWIVGRIGYKASITAALATMGCGLLLFVPASIVISYPVFLFALFVVGSGLALLQVAINPYVGALGKPETASSRLNLCGGLNSLATTIAPKVGAAFIFIAAGATTAQLARSVRLPYVILAAFTFLIAIITRFVHLPELIEKSSATSATEGSAWQFTHLRLGAAAIFAYVGVEVAIGSILINFLGQPSMGSLSHVVAAGYVSLYWGGAMVGRFIGSFALIYIRAQRALAAVSVLSRHPRRHHRLRSRPCCHVGDRRVRSFQLRDVALHLPALAARSRHLHQPGLRHPRDDGRWRRRHPRAARSSRRQVRLPAQFPHCPALLRLPRVLRAQRLQSPPTPLRLPAQLRAAGRDLTTLRRSPRLWRSVWDYVRGMIVRTERSSNPTVQVHHRHIVLARVQPSARQVNGCPSARYSRIVPVDVRSPTPHLYPAKKCSDTYRLERSPPTCPDKSKAPRIPLSITICRRLSSGSGTISQPRSTRPSSRTSPTIPARSPRIFVVKLMRPEFSTSTSSRWPACAAMRICVCPSRRSIVPCSSPSTYTRA